MNSKSIRCSTFCVVLMLLAIASGCSVAPQQNTYASPDLAVSALVDAARAHDQKTLINVLGPGSDEIVYSGDEVADQQNLDHFLARFDESHRLQANGDGSQTLIVGNNQWPMPIPIVRDEKNDVWRFDTAAGKEEILNRRIGRDELNVIQVCQAIVDAQIEYAQRDPNGDGEPEYAQKFLSDPGKKNGLYWKTEEGEPVSPLGPLVAEAADQGYVSAKTSTGEPAPYFGYFYRMLKSQGADAPGGACDYVVGGKMIGGFAVVAYPAAYDNSGVMTFIVNHNGVVYQQNLGVDTAKVAKEMSTFDPGPGWTKVE